MSVSLLLHEELPMVAVSEDWNTEVFQYWITRLQYQTGR
jgi:hypothetical protein